MINFLWKKVPITHKITSMVCTLCGASVTGMLISASFSADIQGNANIINQIGSIRMQTYHLLSESNDRNSVQEISDNIDQYLYLPSFVKYINSENIESDYNKAINIWFKQLRPLYLENSDQLNIEEKKLLSEIFIKNLNNIIYQIDVQTERQIDLINQIQYFFIFIIVIIALLSIINLKKRLFMPWKELLYISNEIKNGQFDKKFQVKGYKDEMGKLGSSINVMSSKLNETYKDLELIIYDKTEELELKNKYLSFLYRSCKFFNNERYNCKNLYPLVNELMGFANLIKVNIYIYDTQQSEYVEKISFGNLRRPNTCQDLSCDNCISSDRVEHAKLTKRSWQLSDTHQEYGYIQTYMHEDESLKIKDEELIIAFADLLTQSLSINYKEQQQQQLMLLKERNVIARELHDSIAQSLSCLKIKTSILQMNKINLNSEQQEIISEIRHELNTAYSQLRELLTTFRLKLDGIGFVPALQNTIIEYNKKLNFEIDFEYDLPANVINNHQSIHLLQIIREILNNIYKHADAEKVSIHLNVIDDKITLNIEDNGIGFSNAKESTTPHYGLKIIDDRTQSLSGEWHISSIPNQGTTFCLEFPITVENNYE